MFIQKKPHTFYINMLLIVHYYADISIYRHKSENKYDFLNCEKVEASRLWVLNEFHTFGPKCENGITSHSVCTLTHNVP